MTGGPTEAGHHRGRLAVGGSLLALAIAVGGGIYLGFQEPPGQVQRLPNGSVLELRGVTYGTNGRFFDGNGWQSLLYRLGRSGPEIGGYLGTTPSWGHVVPGRSGLGLGELNLWFRHRERERASVAGIPAWFDEHGCRIYAAGGEFSGVNNEVAPWLAQRWESMERLVASPINFPRRQSRATFALLGETRAAPHATFTVAIPQSGPFHPWNAPPCPVTSVAGDTTFTLTRLQHLKDESEDWCEAIFAYAGKASSSRNWRPFEIAVSDATGNTLNTLCSPSDAPQRAEFYSLCAREPAWKLTARFARPRPAEVPPDYTWTIRDFPAPKRNTASKPVLRFKRDEILIELRRINGTGAWTHDEGGSTLISTSELPGMTFDVNSPNGLQWKVLRLVDQNGRDLMDKGRAGRPAWYDLHKEALGPGNQSIDLEFASRPSTRRLNFTFGIWKMRTAEFLVRP